MLLYSTVLGSFCNELADQIEITMLSELKTMVEIDLKAEQETIKNYRDRIRQAECAGELALSETL